MQRRMAERTGFDIPFEFELGPAERAASHACGPVMHKARVVNISPHGLGLLTDCALVKGRVLRLAFPAVDTAAVPIFAEIVWIDPVGSCSVAGARFLLQITTAFSRESCSRLRPA